MLFFKRIVIVTLSFCLVGIAFAQKKEFTAAQYFKNDFKDILKPLPTVIKWIDGSHAILKKNDTYVMLDCKKGTETPYTLPQENATPMPIIKQNDLYYDGVQLTQDSDVEVNPTLSPDGKFIAFTKKNNLYTVDIASKKINQLTTDGSDVILNGYASWVYYEEILGRASRYRSYWWSPDSKQIAFFRSDDTKVPTFTLTDAPGQHGVVEVTRYPKVGDPNPEVKIGIVSTLGGNITWCDFNEKDDQYFGQPFWKPDGSGLLVQWMNRLQNDLEVYDVNPSTGKKTPFYSEKQKTWVELDDVNRFYFLPTANKTIIISDATGWRHLYLHDMSGKRLNTITSGDYTVTAINAVDEKNSIVYFTARSRENSATRDYYRVNLNGSGLQRLTFGPYTHKVSASPTNEYFITTYSNTKETARMAVVDNKGKIIKELALAQGADFNQYQIARTELLRVKSDDGLFNLPMKVTWPLNMEPGKKYPVLISIYGGPDAGTVNDSYELTGTQQWYAKEGLIQVAMDHRASGHFGKAGVNYMYHDFGNWELQDYSTLVKWLIANGQADPQRICITGFSYGGYMTCMALTKFSDVFTYGMAGGSVTDFSLYDTHYTERYMGTPKNNAEGYKTGNAMYYVDQYKKGLLLVHGIVDDNVHMQNSIQLISKLQDAKKDFEMMLYSGGRHGWGGAKSEHFSNLQKKFVYKNLLQKDVPKEFLK